MTLLDVRALAEIFALVAAGVYFLYRLLSGYFFVNLSLALDCTRQRIRASAEDYLVVTATLTKGDKDSLRLHDAKVSVTWPGNESPEPKALNGIDRKNHNNVSRDGKQKMVINNFRETNTDRPLLNMTPNEMTSFSCYFEVPHDAICTVELAVLGEKVFKPESKLWPKLFSPMVQWQASKVAMPIEGRSADTI
jgi:hypothetical protein